MNQSKAVFVDHSGRRRKLILAGVIVFGAVVLTLTVTLINAVLSDTRLPGMSWPGQQPQIWPSAAPAPSVSLSSDSFPRTTGPAKPTPSATPSRRTTASPSASRTPSATSAPSPKPSPSRAASPSPTKSTQEPTATTTTSEAPNPGHSRTPPGQVKKTS